MTEGEKGENKTGAKFCLYTVYIYMYVYKTYLCNTLYTLYCSVPEFTIQNSPLAHSVHFVLFSSWVYYTELTSGTLCTLCTVQFLSLLYRTHLWHIQYTLYCLVPGFTIQNSPLAHSVHLVLFSSWVYYTELTSGTFCTLCTVQFLSFISCCTCWTHCTPNLTENTHVCLITCWWNTHAPDTISYIIQRQIHTLGETKEFSWKHKASSHI